MKNIFNTVKVQAPQHNTFDLTHDVKLSGKMGQLIPIMVMDCVPGDKIDLGTDTLIRFAPLIAPVMHRMDVTIHHFFVPNRILWENWEKFITNETTGGLPYITVTDALTDSAKRLLDYLGIPPCPLGGVATQVNALPIAAYQAIYSEYYRDQNLIAEVQWPLVDGDNSGNADLLQLRLRAWEHDYFTAALPFAQKGAAVEIPLGEVELKPSWATAGQPYFDSNGTIQIGPVQNAGGPAVQINGANSAYDPQGTLQVGSTTINDLRRAFKLQEWLEKNARGGTRYIEQILMHFGVRSSDKRLQRPEYITGTKSPVVVSEVLNTTGETAGLPQGNMAGHGVSVGNGYIGSYFAEEHGYIIGILSVMPKPAYMQGIPRHYRKFDPLDYYWPSFANIGEQEIKNMELYAYTADGNNTFGYIPRYAEYKYIPNRVAGDFRTTLDYWHLARELAPTVALNADFIECDPVEVTRIFAVEAADDNLYMHILNKVKARRPMPVFGTPML